MNTTLKDGDLVELKSGGPTMTVSHAADEKNLVRCQWFAGKKLEHGYFLVNTLKEAAPVA